MAVVGDIAGPKLAVFVDMNKVDRGQQMIEQGWKNADVTGGMLEVDMV